MNKTPSTTTPQLTTKLRRWLLILLVAATPSLVSYLLVTTNGYQVSNYLPNFSDEISYWSQINTFRVVGLNGGYYTINELAPSAKFTHFYTYGPWFPALYGTIARIIGWSSTAIISINAFFLGFALVIFCVVARLGNRQLIFTILLLSTMWGIHLYLFTAMQEAYQQALAVLLASLFVIALREREKTSIRVKIIGFLLIAFATVMRLSWAVLFLPFFGLTGKKSPLYWSLYMTITAGATASILLFANYTGAPGNNSIFDVIQTFQSSFIEGLSYLVRYLVHNLGRFLFLPKPATDVLQTYQVVVFIIALMAFIIQKIVHHGRKSPIFAESLFYLYNLAVTVLAACALYIIGTGGDYRLLLCHLLITLLVMITFKRYLPIFIFITTNLLALFLFLTVYQTTVLNKFTPDHSSYKEFQTVAEHYMPYDAQTNNAWCNTMLISVGDYNAPALLAAPAGIAISFYRDIEEPILTFKSHYLLLNTTNYNLIQQRNDRPTLEYLADTPTGSLYLNRSADCPPRNS